VNFNSLPSTATARSNVYVRVNHSSARFYNNRGFNLAYFKFEFNREGSSDLNYDIPSVSVLEFR
ncbi:MAG: hypothetical protein OXN89_08190, partial [Bryobacterales bacterium]|nr:hypothetical protein [Bryobacterales bacterium]